MLASEGYKVLEGTRQKCGLRVATQVTLLTACVKRYLLGFYEKLCNRYIKDVTDITKLGLFNRKKQG
ncbi:hypothetical protein CG436_15950 [Pantoea ananatis]|nr:hypothetical protein CG436_15950 [Pantoea ananatis]